MAVTPGTGRHEPTRADVRAYWEDVVAGRRTRTEASHWAYPWVQANFTGDELVLRALLYLHAIDLGVDDAGGVPLHQEGPAVEYLASDGDVATALSRWLRELAIYDDDPDAWNRRHIQTMLRDHAARHGADRARSFGAKLVAARHLTTADVVDALRSPSPGPSHSAPRWPPAQ